MDVAARTARAIVWLLAAAAALLPAAAAQAAGPAHLSFDVRVAANLLPLPNGYQVDGVFPARSGAPAPVILTEVVSGNSFSGTWVAYDGRGGLRGTDHGTQHNQGNGTSAFTERLSVTGGTGRYRSAHGTLTGTGTVQLATGAIAERISGGLRVAPGGRLPAPAAHPRSRSYSAVAREEVAQVQGPTETLAGPVTGLTPGGGALVIQVARGTPTATAQIVYYDGAGTIAGSASLRRTPNPDGSVSLSGAGAFASGTGRYRRVRVRPGGGFTGTRNPQNGLVTLALGGSLSY